MPEVGGFDVVEAIGVARMPAVIFVTATTSMHFARSTCMRSTTCSSRSTGIASAPRSSAHGGAGGRAGQLDRRIAAALGELGRPAQDYAKRLAIKGDGRVILVDVDEVDRLETAGNYVEVHSGARHHLVRETMASLEARLDPARFVRVSRSSIVNADRVRELQPMFNGDFVVVLRDGTKVSGSRRYRAALERLTR